MKRPHLFVIAGLLAGVVLALIRGENIASAAGLGSAIGSAVVVAGVPFLIAWIPGGVYWIVKRGPMPGRGVLTWSLAGILFLIVSSTSPRNSPQEQDTVRAPSPTNAAALVQAEIDAIPELRRIQSKGGKEWDYARQMDRELRQDPDWANKPMGERFTKALELTQKHFNIASDTDAKQ